MAQLVRMVVDPPDVVVEINDRLVRGMDDDGREIEPYWIRTYSIDGMDYYTGSVVGDAIVLSDLKGNVRATIRHVPIETK